MLGVQQEAQLKAIESTLHDLVDRCKSSTTKPMSVEISTLEQMMSKVRVSEENVAKELDIVRSLGFKSPTVRHDAIPDAHRATFQWVFEGNNAVPGCGPVCNENKPSQLLEWLSHGNGAFWVSGKPGSGKSTFMKFISNHPMTREALSQWAHPLPAVIASHYFWSLGTDMQRSQKGLLQSLIYDIFRHCPDLIKLACESRWNEKGQTPWTLSELQSTMEALSARTQVPCKFCFFIDGLDEFEGDHIEFCESLIALLDSSNIKLCVSSRPWNVFEDAFGQERQHKMYIHTLTNGDIFRYARDRLQQHPRWKVLNSQTTQANTLVKSIAQKAHGVFLWVFLVTKLLREGLTNEDTFADLERMLESFPEDLEPFFRQIIDSVPGFYKARTGEVLRIALSAHEPLDAMVYSCHDDCQDVYEETRREQIVRRLNGWCKGLLEINFLGQIDFLHRTVADFLRTKEMSKYLISCTGADFHPSFAILKAYRGWLSHQRTFRCDSSTTICDLLSEPASVAIPTSHLHSPLTPMIRTALQYASIVELEGTVEKSSLDNVVDSIDLIIMSLVSSFSLSAHIDDPSFNYTRLFRELVLETPLLEYLKRKIPEDRCYFSDFDRPAIYVVLHYPEPRSPDRWPIMAEQKLASLLESGYDPNQKIPGTAGETIWAQFIDETMPANLSGGVDMGPRFISALQLGLFQIFLGKGNADPNAGFESETVPILDRFLLLSRNVPHSLSEDDVAARYLTALDALITRGARLRRYGTGSGREADPREGRDPWPGILNFDFKAVEPARARFFKGVILRAIPLLRDSGWSLNGYRAIPIMLELPDLLETKHAGIGEQQGSRVKRKLPDEERPMEWRGKRLAFLEDLMMADDERLKLE